MTVAIESIMPADPLRISLGEAEGPAFWFLNSLYVEDEAFYVLDGNTHLSPMARKPLSARRIYLLAAPDPPFSHLQRANHQDRSTLTRNLQLLLLEGWIKEVPHEAGGRSIAIVITKAGRDLLHQTAPAWRIAQTQAKLLLGKTGVTAVMDISKELPHPAR